MVEQDKKEILNNIGLNMERFKMKKDSLANYVIPILILPCWFSEVALPFKD